MNALRLGAPSLTGREAQELVAEKFSAAVYPLKIKVSSLVSIMLVFPAVGINLKPVGHYDEDYVVTTIRDFDQFQRLASDIGQIADMWGKEELVEISEFVEEESEGDIEQSINAKLSDGSDPEGESEGLEVDNIKLSGKNATNQQPAPQGNKRGDKK